MSDTKTVSLTFDQIGMLLAVAQRQKADSEAHLGRLDLSDTFWRDLTQRNIDKLTSAIEALKA